jgi:hypothetical protein
VFVTTEFAVLSVRDNEVGASLAEPLAKRTGVARALGNYPFRLRPRPAFGAGTLISPSVALQA